MAGRESCSAMLVLLLSGLVAVVLLSSVQVEATSYQVGGNGSQWTVPSTNSLPRTTYGDWASNINFTTDDEIVFIYNNTLHNVWQLGTAEAFTYCNFTTADLKKVDNGDTGNTTVSFKNMNSSTMWYTSTNASDCDGGMKFALKVYLAPVHPPSSSPSSPPKNAAPRLASTMGFGTALVVVTFAASFLL